MLRRAEYKQLAEKINRRMEWPPLGWEMLLFYAVAFVVPPLAAFLMVRAMLRFAGVPVIAESSD
jgi:hypothetical protein